MITFDQCREIALSFPESTEEAHFEKTSFRINSKIFATYEKKSNTACIKLSKLDQEYFCATNKRNIYPVDNRWGTKGWTIIEMNNVGEAVFIDVLKTAYCEVAPQRLAGQVKGKE